ncbi:hypothetical protein UFOVP462_19 [uncultured Caudovirales phage]|uniref:Uncharacterized protein n=1 Tax=uncultured Caudovirales phage TaxID=2100421 RepID=A0A6J5MG90_9CAUD|nr:hypothetical protein UFOVP462_19 [uncultured Caudovirales phage]
MEHIRQKINLLLKGVEVAYTVVDTTGWTLPLSEHPSIVEHPELFEISSDDIPDNAQYLKYI